MQIFENFSLKGYSTFNTAATADFFAEVDSADELSSLLSEFSELPKLVLGEGSNMLFASDFHGLIIHQRSSDYVISEDGIVTADAGVNWHRLVTDTVKSGLWGIENLAYIPGSTGAAPVQNIGAYGAEIKDVLDSVIAFDTKTNSMVTMSNVQCDFAYRDSVFKHEPERYIVTKVSLKLSPERKPNLSYPALTTELNQNRISDPTQQDIFETVIGIRKRKLPDPTTLPNAGSFFKNPVVTQQHFQDILNEFPEVPSFPANEGFVKIPAAWLIETAGWKGKRIGGVGTSPDHALVIVNFGNTSGAEIVDFCRKIQSAVEQMFEIQLEPEVRIIV